MRYDKLVWSLGVPVYIAVFTQEGYLGFSFLVFADAVEEYLHQELVGEFRDVVSRVQSSFKFGYFCLKPYDNLSLGVNFDENVLAGLF